MPVAASPHDVDVWSWAIDPSRAVACRCSVEAINDELSRSRPTRPATACDLNGDVRPFDADRLLRRLPGGARRVGSVAGGQIDVYHDPADAGRYWTVDDACGLSEIDLLRGRWTSWVLPDAARRSSASVLDAAVHWPLAHLLCGRGTHLIPAASATVGGRGVLIVSPFGLDAECRRIDRAESARMRLLSGGWTTVRETAGGIVLRAFPDPHGGSSEAWCDAVVLVDPGRPVASTLAPLVGGDAIAACRAAWPVPGLTAQRRGAQFAARLARRCSVWRARLSDDPADLGRLLGTVAAAFWPPTISTRPLRRESVAA